MILCLCENWWSVHNRKENIPNGTLKSDLSGQHKYPNTDINSKAYR